MTTIFPTITDIKFTKNTFSGIFKNEDKERSIQSFEIENDSISNLYTIKLIIDAKKVSITEDNMKNALKQFVQFKVYYSIDGKEKYKYFSGIIDEINFLAFKDRNLIYQYELILKPYLFLLTKNNSRRSWTNKSTKEIILILLNNYINKYKIDHLEVSVDFKTYQKGNDSHLKYKNKIQYDISDYNLICQLMQEDGLDYIIEQTEMGQRIIFSDEIVDYFKEKNEALEIKMEVSTIPLENDKYQNQVQFFGYIHSIKSGIDNIVTSYIDPRKFGSPITSQDISQNNNPFKYEHFQNIHKSSELLGSSTAWPKSEKKRKNTSNNNVTLIEKRHILSVGDLLNFVQMNNNIKSNLIKLDNYFISSIKHIYARADSQNEFNLSNVNQNLSQLNCNYCAEIIAHPIDTKYLKDFGKTKNIIPGVITAKIFGEKPEDLKIETDKAGIMLGVSFYWQSDKKNMECSLYSWARLSQPWASKEYGSIFIPLPKDEVAIVFEEGDPDLPIILGSFYNSVNKLGLDLTKEEDKHTRGFIFGENQMFILKSKDKKSLVTLNDEDLKIEIQEKMKIDMNKDGKYEMHSEQSILNSKNSLKIDTKDAKILATDKTTIKSGSSIEVEKGEVKINKLKISK